jgi:hypothetical protein
MHRPIVVPVVRIGGQRLLIRTGVVGRWRRLERVGSRLVRSGHLLHGLDVGRACGRTQ